MGAVFPLTLHMEGIIMALQTLDQLANDNQALIRKFTRAVLWVGPPSVALPVTLTQADARTVTDGVTTAASTTVTSATAAFTAGDVGAGITGGSIPAGTTIASVTNATTVVISAAATAAGTAVSLTVTASSNPGLAPLPTGMKPVGLVTKKDGFKFVNKTNLDVTESFGYSAPTRRDIIGEDAEVKFTAQQSSKQIMSMFHHLDLSGVIQDANGEISFAKPLAPDVLYYRAMLIARDGRGANAQYYGVLYPNSSVSDSGEQDMVPSGEFAYPMTLAAAPDPAAGFAVKYFWGGPGFKAQGIANGFAVA